MHTGNDFHYLLVLHILNPNKDKAKTTFVYGGFVHVKPRLWSARPV